jgi:hypothetical protein
MSLIALIIGGALLLVMICVSLYGAAALPPGAQMPVHFGPAGYNRWVPKSIGLVLYPAAGAVAYVIIIVAVRDHQTHGGLGPAVGLSIALGVLLITQIGALMLGISRSSRGHPRPDFSGE